MAAKAGPGGQFPDQQNNGQIPTRRGATEFASHELHETTVPKLAHELRTRLAIIRGSVDNVRDGVFGEINSNQKKYLAIAAESVERMSELVEDLMASLAPGRAQIRINREAVSIIDIIRIAVESTHSLAYKEGINILANFPKGAPKVFCDRVKIEQVLLNLFRNSIKFTSRGGAITVSLAQMEKHVEVKVSDTGVGIPRDKLDSIFEDKSSAEMHSEDGGYRTSGLGLIIIKDILDAHGSRVTVKSEIGRGTQFTFTLPLAE